MGKYIQSSVWMRMGIVVLGALFCTSMFGQDVSNVEFRQDGKKVIISYSLSEKSRVSVFLSTDGGLSFEKALKKVVGDVGDNVSSGDNTIIWSPLEEMDAIQGDDITFMVKAISATPLYLGTPGIYVAGQSNKWWAPFNVGSTTETGYGTAHVWTSNSASRCPSGWRIPTETELKNLIDSGSEWTTKSGVKGSLFGGVLFLPAAGYDGGATAGTYGYYWSSSPYDDSSAYHLIFNSGAANVLNDGRSNWFPVRCVQN